MSFRVATLNMEQDHKRWMDRRELIIEQLGELRPDVFAMNEICVPLQSARWLRREAADRFGLDYALVQQTRTNAASVVDAEGILTRYPILETANLDYRTRDQVAQVARIDVEGHKVDVYVTHLYMSRGEDSLRLYQVQQLLEWTVARDDVDAKIVCGDFNATLDMPSAALMAEHSRPSQAAPTAFTPLEDSDGLVTHPYWDRLDRCIDYIWAAGPLRVIESGVCFDRASADDPTLWPSDHLGVWADLEFS